MRELLHRLRRWLDRRQQIRHAAAEAESIHHLLSGRDFADITRGRKLRQRSLQNWCGGQNREAFWSWPHQRREGQK